MDKLAVAIMEMKVNKVVNKIAALRRHSGLYVGPMMWTNSIQPIINHVARSFRMLHMLH